MLDQESINRLQERIVAFHGDLELFKSVERGEQQMRLRSLNDVKNGNYHRETRSGAQKNVT